MPAMKMMIFVVKVRMFPHNLAFLEIVCYVFFNLVVILRFCLCSLLFTGEYFACFRAPRRHWKNISNLVKVSLCRLRMDAASNFFVCLLTKKYIKSARNVIS